MNRKTFISILSAPILTPFFAMCAKIKVKINSQSGGRPAGVNNAGGDTIAINDSYYRPPATGTRIPMIVFNGESNSGGYADNADATGTELAARTGTFILNNTSLEFENLDVGTNNLIDHAGLTDNASHSWEIGIANAAAAGDFYHPVYLVKTGQGGSISGDWTSVSAYGTTAVSRIDAAIAELGTSGTPKFALFHSQGINNAGGGWNRALWVTQTKTWFNYLRTTYGSFPIIMMKFWPITGRSIADLNDAVDEVCGDLSDCFSIDCSSFTDLRDALHLDYIGQKAAAALYIDKLIAEGYYL